VKITVFYLGFYVASSLLLYFLEHDIKNPENQCETIFDAFWINTVFIFSGFENFGPITRAGKALSFLSFTMGLVTITLVTGKIASSFVIKAMMKEGKMRKDLSGHILICNWHDGAEKIVKEIHAPQADPEIEIVVLTRAEVPEENLRYNTEFEKVFFMRCDPTLHSSLKGARVSEARSVIILADQAAPDPDANTAMISLAITRLASATNRPHIVAEAVNHRKTEHLKDAGVDEIICASDFQYGIIAQCGMLGKFGKLSEVYQQLLTYSDNTNELYIIPPGEVPRVLHGKSFGELCAVFTKTRESSNPLILLGLLREGKVILNPRHDAGQTAATPIKESDGLVVMSYDKPNLNVFAS
jgi:voltage-gated potassium channel